MFNKYGWKPDLPDARDCHYSINNINVNNLLSSIDLRTGCPAVYDQGELGSCTANALGAAWEYERKVQKLSDFMPSRLFIYYNERSLEGTISSDAGAEIRDGIKSLNTDGIASEQSWPYVITKFTKKPTATVYKAAKKNTILSYERLDNTNINVLKACLSANRPFVFGFTVYQSFESNQTAKTGIMSMPNFKTEKSLGGHAVMAVGYDDLKQSFIIRNSWGSSWGDKGYFYMPYAYIVNPNLADDFWTIKIVS